METKEKPTVPEKVKYTPELLGAIEFRFKNGASIKDLGAEFGIPERSLIAKLSSIGLYKRKPYVNKQGHPPIKKEEYVERIAKLLGKDICLLESLEKVNKSVLKMIEEALK